MLKYLRIYYVFVALPYLLLLVGAAMFFDPIKRTILNNPIPHLNYTIIVIVLSGGILILLNSRRLVREARIMTEFSAAIRAKTDSASLREMTEGYTGDLACILQMVSTSGDRTISHQEQAALEHELINARSRLVRRNALPQYLTGLLVAMGLLGTFIGLLATLADISVLIGSFADIDMANVDPIQVFRVMIERMKAPMTSMGIAFSTSMFGLLGSIVIGLMMLGIRRLQGDIFSVLSSEVARHIETALSFESISFRGGEMVAGASGVGGETRDLTVKILLRIEERLAEAARIRQRALSAEIDDFKKQRADMLHVMAEQAEASHNFRGELQQLGRQLGSIFTGMEKGGHEISAQISELSIRLAADAGKSHQLLANQIDEQQQLGATLASFNIEERLAEAAQLQQRALAAGLDEFKNQRAEMLRTLTEQSAASHGFRSELQQLGRQLATIFGNMEKGSGEISNQISELTVHVTADAKESQRLLTTTNSNVRNGLMQLGGQLGKLSAATEKGNGEICVQVAELQTQMMAGTKESQQLFDVGSRELRTELQQVGSQLGNKLGILSTQTEKGHEQAAVQLIALQAQLAAGAKQLQKLLETANTDVQGELQAIGNRLTTIFKLAEQGNSERADQSSALQDHLSAGTVESHKLLGAATNNIRGELRRLGGQLGTISEVLEQGNSQVGAQISELTGRMAANAEESQRLLAALGEDPEPLVNEQAV